MSAKGVTMAETKSSVSAANLAEGRDHDGFAGGEGRARALPWKEAEHVG
jgi:hypothetical protein